ncbi:hypothetical protein JXO59_01260 [candidate division KSB1 bacterium]|nr:hypothetical protein [candidate division KSB1 bacterium]
MKTQREITWLQPNLSRRMSLASVCAGENSGTIEEIRYSEDMKHGQSIKSPTILNPLI